MSDFEFNMAGLRELMKSAKMEAALTNAGKRVADMANGSSSGYGTNTHQAPFTAVCSVHTTTWEAIHDNYENNTLLKAVQSVGLDMKAK